MQSAQSYAARYQTTQVQTADQIELLLILYKSAVAQIRAAKRHLASGDIAARVNAINRAISMVGELQNALDFERGGSIAVSLDQLYGYIFQRLTVGNARSDTEPLDEVIGLLTTLEGAWEEIRSKGGLSVQDRNSFGQRLAQAG